MTRLSPAPPLDAALAPMSVRSRSVREFQDRLRRNGFTPEEISGCMDRLTER